MAFRKNRDTRLSARGRGVHATCIGCEQTERDKQVQTLLQCSMRWAYELTEPTRRAADAAREAARDAAIAQGKEAGKSVREIADEVGISKSAVGRAISGGVPRSHDAEAGQPDAVPPPVLPARDIPLSLDAETGHYHPLAPAVAEYREATSSRGERWWAAYRALCRAFAAALHHADVVRVG